MTATGPHGRARAGSKLQQASHHAHKAGFSSRQKAGGTRTDCKLAPQGAAAVAGSQEAQSSLEYCDLKQLKIQIDAPDKSTTIMIDRVRREEPVEPATPRRYRAMLKERDLVIETLADIAGMKVTDYGSAGESSAKTRQLTITAQATNACTHTSFYPLCPVTGLDRQDGGVERLVAGAQVSADYTSHNPGTIFNSGLSGLWPFNRVRNYTVGAVSCGNLPIPQRTITQLSAEVYVLPYEEWGISIGLGPRSAGSTSKVSNYKTPKDGKSGRKVERKIIVMKQTAGTTVTHTTEEMTTRTGRERTRETLEITDRAKIGSAKELGYAVLGPKNETVKAVAEDWNNQIKFTPKSTEQEYRKVQIKHTVAGREVECDINDVVKDIFAVKELIDKIKKIFDSVKFGASFKVEYELFSGSLEMRYGNEWPQNYAEDGRVYYVGHYIAINGTLNVFDSRVTGFCGLAVESPTSLIDFAVDIGGYLSAAIATPISAELNHSWGKDASDWTGKLAASPSFKLEGGFRANGRAFGYGVSGKIALEYTINLTVEGEVSTRHPLSVKSSLIFGAKQTNGKGKDEYAAVRLVAELTTQGGSINSWKIKPFVLIDGAVAWEDYYLIGEKPKD